MALQRGAEDSVAPPVWQPGPSRQKVGFGEERVSAAEGLAYMAASDRPRTLGRIQFLWAS